MSLCEAILKKPIYSIELADIEEFFSTEQEETSTLEFKSGRSEIDDIYREICAFLNTEGGLLVIGAPKETSSASDKSKRVCVGPLDASLIRSQDKLLSRISSNISPPPYGLKAKSFNLGEGYVYLVEVPQSLTPPHQVSSEGKYYIRLEREAKPAPHGIVEALFLRRQKPDLDAEIFIKQKPQFPGRHFVEFQIYNRSNYPAEKIGYVIDLKGVASVRDKPSTEPYIQQDEFFTINNTLDDNILVKGLSHTVEFEIQPAADLLYVSISCYCKDSPLRTMAEMFSFSKFDWLDMPDARDANSENYLLEAQKEYKNARINQIKAFLNVDKLSQKVLFFPSNESEVHAALAEFQTPLPFSYLNFFAYSNGASLGIDTFFLNFYPIKQLKISTKFHQEGKIYLDIGETNEEMITLEIDQETTHSLFGIHKKYSLDRRFRATSRTFDELLLTIYQDILEFGRFNP